MKFLQYLNPFRKPTAQQMRNVMIEDAERLAIEHTRDAERAIAEAKNHRTLADMYNSRVKRLRKEVAA